MGQLCIRQGEQTLSRFRSHKTAALLAYLAFHKQPQSREILVDLFWPESTLSAGRLSLSVALSSLRHQLEPPGVPAGAIIVADRYKVGLHPAAVTTDVAQFEAALRFAGITNKAHGGYPHEPIRIIEQAVSGYQGRLLPGFYDDWIGPEQERLGRLFLDAVHTLIERFEEIGELSSALVYARQAVSLEPLQERAHADLMRLLWQTGQPGEALKQYHELVRLLKTEAGETPQSDTHHLARQIEQGVFAPPVPVLPALFALPDPAPPALPIRPSGTVTFLLTEVDGSNATVRPKLDQQMGQQMG